MKRIRVGIVNYLNTRPLLYGIESSDLMEEMELVKDYPSNVARALLDGRIDMGLVPVAIIPKMDEYYINTDFCIGCDGEVASVSLHSDVPVSEIKYVLLDYQSRTSVQLAKV
ncbi:MAG: MqnA/MqnD/SBP family protein, partial [Flavitalea sp.]